MAVSYHRALTGKERLSLGGSLVFDRGKFPNYEYRIFTLAPEMKLKYTKAVQKFNLYGLLGVGVTFGAESNETVNSKITHTNIQLTPIGIEFGNKLKGFFELGIGYKGIISGGISYRF